MTDKIRLEFVKNQDSIGVELLSEERNVSEKFRISEDSFRELFSGRFSTGYFFVSQDGPIYIEAKDGAKVVVVQRALRHNQTIRWNQHGDVENVSVTTPWSFFLFRLIPSGDNYVWQKQRLYVSSGPARGGATPLFSAKFLGNVYDEGRNNATNICWGNTAVTPGGLVSLASLVNIANDFYSQTFTAHLERSTQRWLDFTATGKVPGESIFTLDTAIAEIWNNER